MKIYQFPALPQDALASMPFYGLCVEAVFIKDDDTGSRGDLITSGSLKNLRQFSDDQLGGYQLASEFLYDYNDYNFEDKQTRRVISARNKR